MDPRHQDRIVTESASGFQERTIAADGEDGVHISQLIDGAIGCALDAAGLQGLLHGEGQEAGDLPRRQHCQKLGQVLK